MIGIGSTELIVVFFVFSTIGLVPVIAVWKIAAKAGLSPWISLTQILPPLNLIGLFYIAFAEWPSRREEQ